MYISPHLGLDLARYGEREISALAEHHCRARQPRGQRKTPGLTVGRAGTLLARGLARRRALIAPTAKPSKPSGIVAKLADRVGTAGKRGSTAAAPRSRPQ